MVLHVAERVAQQGNDSRRKVVIAKGIAHEYCISTVVDRRHQRAQYAIVVLTQQCLESRNDISATELDFDGIYAMQHRGWYLNGVI